MIKVKFKNLEKSEIVGVAIKERLEVLQLKFDELNQSRMEVTLEMQNAPTQAGPDLFKVKVYVKGGRYNGIAVEKSNPNAYAALAEVVGHMLEILNRYGDRARIVQRKHARRVLGFLKQAHLKVEKSEHLFPEHQSLVFAN